MQKNDFNFNDAIKAIQENDSDRLKIIIDKDFGKDDFHNNNNVVSLDSLINYPNNYIMALQYFNFKLNV